MQGKVSNGGFAQGHAHQSLNGSDQRCETEASLAGEQVRRFGHDTSQHFHDIPSLESPVADGGKGFDIAGLEGRKHTCKRLGIAVGVLEYSVCSVIHQSTHGALLFGKGISCHVMLRHSMTLDVTPEHAMRPSTWANSLLSCSSS
jgi:hypothetical protein